MTLSEFKAWFEGYTEGLEGAPTAAQFARIKEKVATIDGATTTYPIYVDRYVPQWAPYLGGGTFICGAAGAQGVGISTTQTMAVSAIEPFNNDPGHTHTIRTALEPFDSLAAMYALGKADALAA